MDATVDWAGPDLKFKNDTDYGILIKAWAGRRDDDGVVLLDAERAQGREDRFRATSRTSPTPAERYILKRGLADGSKVQDGRRHARASR